MTLRKNALIELSFHAGGMIDKPLLLVMKHLAEVGYDGIELLAGPRAHIRTDDALEPQLQSVKSLLHKHKLQPAAINPYTVPGLATMTTEWGVDKTREFFTKLMDLASGVGAPTVNFLPGLGRDE